MEIFSAGFNAHKPLVVRHLLQIDRSAIGDNFVESGPTVCQLAYAGVVLPPSLPCFLQLSFADAEL